MTMEEVFKIGFNAGKGYNVDAGEEEANHCWEQYRYMQLLAISGKDVANDWLKSRHAPASKIENLKCPNCESPMKERSSQYGKFWGCTNYPRCKGTRDSDGLSKEDRIKEKEMIQGPFLEPVSDHEDIGPDPIRRGDGFSFKKG